MPKTNVHSYCLTLIVIISIITTMAKIVINKEIIGSICVLRPVGYVDENGGAALFDSVEKALEEGSKKILLNFTDSPVINSQGIAQLIEMAEIIVDEKGGDLAFCGLSELSHSVFKMVGLLQMGDAYEDEKEALNYLAS